MVSYFIFAIKVRSGYQAWLQLRKDWKSKKDPSTNTRKQQKLINSEVLYEELFETERDGPLSQRVPLPDLISILNEGNINRVLLF